MRFPDGTEIPAEEFGDFAVHAPLGGGKGWVVTHVPTRSCVIRSRLKTPAKSAARSLDWLVKTIGVEDPLIRRMVESLRESKGVVE